MEATVPGVQTASMSQRFQKEFSCANGHKRIAELPWPARKDADSSDSRKSFTGHRMCGNGAPHATLHNPHETGLPKLVHFLRELAVADIVSLATSFRSAVSRPTSCPSSTEVTSPLSSPRVSRLFLEGLATWPSFLRTRTSTQRGGLVEVLRELHRGRHRVFGNLALHHRARRPPPRMTPTARRSASSTAASPVAAHLAPATASRSPFSR